MVKSVKRAKSTVAGAVLATSETGCPPLWGTRPAEVMVATNDSTSQMGASVPKVTTDPEGLDTGEFGSGTVPPFDPHPTVRTAAKMTATPDKNIQFLLLILSSYPNDVVSIATLCMRNPAGQFSFKHPVAFETHRVYDFEHGFVPKVALGRE